MCYAGKPGGRWEHYSHLYVTFAKLILLSLHHLECGDDDTGGYHDVQTLAAVLYHRKYFLFLNGASR